MNWHLVFHLLSLVTVPVLGALAYWRNTRRTTNQFFLALCAVAGLWLAGVMAAFTSAMPERIAFFIRQASASGIFLPWLFDCLRESVMFPSLRWREVVRRGRKWFLLCLIIAILCQTQFFLVRVELPEAFSGSGEIAEPVYGPGMLFFAALFICSAGLELYRLIRDVRRARGVRRNELQFVLLGCGASATVGALCTMIIPILTGSSQSVQFVSLSGIFFASIIAYGIATRRIMEVSQILRTATAYALLTAYLILIYAAVLYTARLVLDPITIYSRPLSYLLAALAASFSMAPGHGFMQRFSQRLFINTRPLDVGSIMETATRTLRTISTVQNLLTHFAQNIVDFFQTDNIRILLLDPREPVFVQAYPAPLNEQGATLKRRDAIARMLEEWRHPIVAETLRRMPESRDLTLAGRQLDDMKSAIAVGICSRHGLEGIMLLGHKVSGRIYDAAEQDTLQLLCNQFAVSIENAKLYTHIQNTNIYNEILLENLVDGVIAADASGVVTVFNSEAQNITRLNAEIVLGQCLDVLPSPLAEALRETLDHDLKHRDLEIDLEADDKVTRVRLGSSTFRGYTGNVLGALLVLEDITEVKELEMQVRRTDRLASLGTLSAGMAHEIKNPLVTIKTFTQLLPERYEDDDFRDTFSSLVGQEVKRIDSIVNQLLRFSRPTKPNLVPTPLHEVIDNSLSLVSEQLRQRNITLDCRYGDTNDEVRADADQLNQALVNLLLNAVDSMGTGGTLTVTTETCERRPQTSANWTENEPCLRLTIQDTGTGIPPDQLTHIFDPFFTTKDQGTGLGLSVSHGIILEHKGTVDVESTPAKGTAFHITFPLASEGVPV